MTWFRLQITRKRLGRLLVSTCRCLSLDILFRFWRRQQSTPDDRVHDGVIHPSEVDRNGGKDREETRGWPKHVPDVVDGEGPPLDEEGHDERWPWRSPSSGTGLSPCRPAWLSSSSSPTWYRTPRTSRHRSTADCTRTLDCIACPRSFGGLSCTCCHITKHFPSLCNKTTQVVLIIILLYYIIILKTVLDSDHLLRSFQRNLFSLRPEENSIFSNY